VASTDKPFPPENRISPAGWTLPQDVVGECPPPRAEAAADCAAHVFYAWRASEPRWVGARFAILQDGDWSTGQDSLFGGGTPPDGSWPKRAIQAGPEVFDVRPWIPRPQVYNTLPTPVAYDATPGGPGNHYKGLGHQAKHDGEMFSTPTASTATGADMVQAKFPGNSPDRPGYDEATKIFAEGKPGVWRTPSARDFKGADPKNATGRQIGLNDQVMKDAQDRARSDGKLWATPQHHDAAAGDAARVGRFGTEAGGRNLTDEVQKFPTPQAVDGHHKAHYSPDAVARRVDKGKAISLSMSVQLPAEFFPTPTSTERAGTNPETGKGGGLSRHVKDQMGLFPVPRSNWPTPIANDAEKRGACNPDDPRNGLTGAVRQDAGLGKIWRSPVASDQRPRRSSEKWEGNDLVSKVTEVEEANGAVLPKSGGQLNPDWVDPLMGYRPGTTKIVPEAAAWLKVDSKRLKAADLKKIHALDEHVEVNEPGDEEAPAEEPKPKKAPHAKAS
jgi:hypothetical protein